MYILTFKELWRFYVYAHALYTTILPGLEIVSTLVFPSLTSITLVFFSIPDPGQLEGNILNNR